MSDDKSGQTIALFADLLSLPIDQNSVGLPADPHRKREMMLLALLRQLDEMTARQPVLMVFEDVHWADSTTLDLLDRGIQRTKHLPVLLLITFRPEFRPPWTGQANVFSMSLNRLGQTDTMLLVDGITHGKTLPPAILEEIVERTDGIPLFVEELTKSVLEGGSLRSEAGSYILTEPLPLVAIPASLQASLLARLDRLSAVKEVAQIGAALGREFSYELLAAVAQHSDADLMGALDRLVRADLVFCRGTPPRSSFVFKHALVQDAAYSTMLRSQRLQLHARIGNALEDQFPEIVETQPEVLAHHFSEAGRAETAIDYWCRAAEQSLRRSASVDAIRQLLRAIELTQSLPPSPERNRRRLEQQLALGRMTRIVRGMAASDTLQVFSKARELLDETATLAHRMNVLYGLWGVHYVRAEHAAARAVASECLDLAKRERQDDAPALANYLMGDTLWATGEFADARYHLERAIELSAPTANGAASSSPHNHDINALSYLAWTLWPLGYIDQAMAAAQQAGSRARASGHVPMTAFVSFVEVFLATALGAAKAPMAAAAERAIAYCVEHGVTAYELWTRFCLGITVARWDDARNGIEIMRASMEALEQIHAKVLRPLHLGHLAAGRAKLGDIEAGLTLLNDALSIAADTGERMFEAELHRMRGELLFEQGKNEYAESALQLAIDVAHRQQARLWELRAATSLARLQNSLGKSKEARQVLAPRYGWFTEGFDTADLRAAITLLEGLT